MDSKTKNDTTLKLLSVGFYLLLASFISFDTAKFLNRFRTFFFYSDLFYVGFSLKILKLLSYLKLD